MALLGPDLQLDDLTGDLVLVNGDLQLAADPVQQVSIRLKFVRGEWFLDVEVGVPYFEDVFVKQPDLDRIRAMYRTVIAETLGISDVRQIDLQYVPETRGLRVIWSADTEAGEIDGTAQLP